MKNKFFDVEEFDFEVEKQRFIDNLDFLKTLSVQESTLYKKWQELNKDLYNTQQKLGRYEDLYDKVWRPTDINNKKLTISDTLNEPYSSPLSLAAISLVSFNSFIFAAVSLALDLFSVSFFISPASNDFISLIFCLVANLALPLGIK